MNKYGHIEILNQEDRKVEILLDGVIGSSFFEEGITLKSIKNEVDRAGKIDEIILNINSPGGLMDEGMAIYNFLAQHDAKVTSKVIGLAASAATFPLMAADSRVASEISETLIHNARITILAVLTKELMKEVSDEVIEMLSKADNLISLLYQARTGIGKNKINKMMTAETTMTGQEALDLGFVDEIIPAKTGEEDFKGVEDYKQELSDIYGMWLDEKKARNKFGESYRVAATLVPELPGSFIKKPHDPKSAIDYRNINSLRYGLSVAKLENNTGEQDKIRGLLNTFSEQSRENKRELQYGKIDLAYGGQVYCLTTQEVDMYNKLLAKLGVSSIEEAEAKVDELQTVTTTSGSGNVQFLNVEEDGTAEQLKKSNELLQELVNDMKAQRKEDKRVSAEKEVEELVKAGYIKGSQKQRFLDEYLNNKANYDFAVSSLKEDEPRYKNVINSDGGGVAGAESADNTDKTKPGKTAQETINRYDALIAEYDPENKDPQGAAARIAGEHPELAEHYEYALQASSGEDTSDNPYLK